MLPTPPVPFAQHASKGESCNKWAGSSEWSHEAKVKAVQSPRQMEENLHFPVFPPDGAELPLKPGWHDVILLSSEPLQVREFPMECKSLECTQVRVMPQSVQCLKGHKQDFQGSTFQSSAHKALPQQLFPLEIVSFLLHSSLSAGDSHYFQLQSIR